MFNNRIIITFGTILIAFFSVALWWSISEARIPIGALAQGKITIEGETITIRAPIDGVVNTSKVIDGASIFENEVMLEFTDDELKTQLETVNDNLYFYQALKDRLLAEKNGLEDLVFTHTVPNPHNINQKEVFNTRLREHKKKLDIYHNNIKTNEMLEQEIKNSLEAALAEFDIVKENQEMKQELHDKGIYTRTQLLIPTSFSQF